LVGQADYGVVFMRQRAVAVIAMTERSVNN